MRGDTSFVREVAAIELPTARQARWLRGRLPVPGPGRAAAVLAAAVGPVDEDRPLGDDVDRTPESLEDLR